MEPMKNYIQPGDVVTLTAPADVKSGEVVIVGGLAGIAATDAKQGAEVETVLVGVFELPKAAGSTLEPGALAYWTESPAGVAGSGATLLGAVVAHAGSDATKVRVRLNGIATA
jgi:predicted RecA/RadA family phage recombinase